MLQKNVQPGRNRQIQVQKLNFVSEQLRQQAQEQHKCDLQSESSAIVESVDDQTLISKHSINLLNMLENRISVLDPEYLNKSVTDNDKCNQNVKVKSNDSLYKKNSSNVIRIDAQQNMMDEMFKTQAIDTPQTIEKQSQAQGSQIFSSWLNKESKKKDESATYNYRARSKQSFGSHLGQSNNQHSNAGIKKPVLINKEIDTSELNSQLPSNINSHDKALHSNSFDLSKSNNHIKSVDTSKIITSDPQPELNSTSRSQLNNNNIKGVNTLLMQGTTNESEIQVLTNQEAENLITEPVSSKNQLQSTEIPGINTLRQQTQNTDLNVLKNGMEPVYVKCDECLLKYKEMHSKLCFRFYLSNQNNKSQGIKVNKKGQCVVGYVEVLSPRTAIHSGKFTVQSSVLKRRPSTYMDQNSSDQRTSPDIYSTTRQSKLSQIPNNVNTNTVGEEKNDDSRAKNRKSSMQQAMVEKNINIDSEICIRPLKQCCCCIATSLAQQKALSVEVRESLKDKTQQIIQINQLINATQKVPTGKLKGRKLAKTSTFAKIAKGYISSNMDFKSQRNKLLKNKKKVEQLSSGASSPHEEFADQGFIQTDSQKIVKHRSYEFEIDLKGQLDKYLASKIQIEKNLPLDLPRKIQTAFQNQSTLRECNQFASSLDNFVHDHVIEIKPIKRITQRKQSQKITQDLLSNQMHVNMLTQLIEHGRNALVSNSQGSVDSSLKQTSINSPYIATPFFDLTQKASMQQYATQVLVPEQKQKTIVMNQTHNKTQRWKRNRPLTLRGVGKCNSRDSNEFKQPENTPQINLCLQITKACMPVSTSPKSRSNQKHRQQIGRNQCQITETINKNLQAKEDELGGTFSITQRRDENEITTTNQQYTPKNSRPIFKDKKKLLSVEINKENKEENIGYTMDNPISIKELSQHKDEDLKTLPPMSRESISSRHSPQQQRHAFGFFRQSQEKQKSIFGQSQNLRIKNASAMEEIQVKKSQNKLVSFDQQKAPTHKVRKSQSPSVCNASPKNIQAIRNSSGMVITKLAREQSFPLNQLQAPISALLHHDDHESPNDSEQDLNEKNSDEGNELVKNFVRESVLSDFKTLKESQKITNPYLSMHINQQEDIGEELVNAEFQKITVIEEQITDKSTASNERLKLDSNFLDEKNLIQVANDMIINSKDTQDPLRSSEMKPKALPQNLNTYVSSAVYGLQKDLNKLLQNVYPVSSAIPRTQPQNLACTGSNIKVVGLDVGRDLRSREQFIKDNFLRQKTPSNMQSQRISQEKVGLKSRRAAATSARLRKHKATKFQSNKSTSSTIEDKSRKQNFDLSHIKTGKAIRMTVASKYDPIGNCKQGLQVVGTEGITSPVSNFHPKLTDDNQSGGKGSLRGSGILFVDYAQTLQGNQIKMLKSHIQRPITQNQQQRTFQEIMVPNVCTLINTTPSIQQITQPVEFHDFNSTTIKRNSKLSNDRSQIINQNTIFRLKPRSSLAMEQRHNQTELKLLEQQHCTRVNSAIESELIAEQITNEDAEKVTLRNGVQSNIGKSDSTYMKDKSSKSFYTEGRIFKQKPTMNNHRHFMEIFNFRNQAMLHFDELKVGKINVEQALMNQIIEKESMGEQSPICRISQEVQKEVDRRPFFSQQKNGMKNIQNFERLSGLIQAYNQQSISNTQQLDTKNHRPNKYKSNGPQLYNDLIEKQKQQENENFENTHTEQYNLAQAFGNIQKRTISNPCNFFRNDDARSQNKTAQNFRGQGSKLVFSDNRRKKDKFKISTNAINKNNKHIIEQLFGDLKLLTYEEEHIPTFKQNCLAEYILEEWAQTIKGQLNKFDKFCRYSSSIRVPIHKSKMMSSKLDKQTENSECYSVILYGKQTPISTCCEQLVCFQILKETSTIDLHCLEPNCKLNPIERRPIRQEILDSIFSMKKPQQKKQDLLQQAKAVSLLASSPENYKSYQSKEMVSKAVSIDHDMINTPVYSSTNLDDFEKN